MEQTEGTLVDWNDDRGFGFITDATGRRHFVHISNIARTVRRPVAGDRMRFTPGPGREGRPAAFKAAIVDVAQVPVLVAKARDWRIAVAIALAALLAMGLILGRLPLWVGFAYVLVGAVSVLAYRQDKVAAEAGHWRVTEMNLLIIDMLGGIIGGLLAQEHYRHKTMKPAFRYASAGIALLHGLWLGGVTAGLITAADFGIIAGRLGLTQLF